jgi:hypothetical protein
MTERLNTLKTGMSVKPHKHSAVTVHAIRQHGGVPYEVERKVCSSCKRLLDERTIKRAAA